MPVDTVKYYTTNGLSRQRATDPSNCCMQCYTAQGSCGAFYHVVTGVSAGTCYLLPPSDITTCNPNADVGVVNFGSSAQSGVAGNSFCGMYTVVAAG